MSDPNLLALNKFIEHYQQLMAHDGYGDIAVRVCLTRGQNKEVILMCGKEFRFLIGGGEKRLQHYKAIPASSDSQPYTGPERCYGTGCRATSDWNDVTSQRSGARAGGGRRRDD
ncbi:MAG: hypothetical protein ABW068_17375 [Candidatus Thiodiazotropha sp.]